MLEKIEGVAIPAVDPPLINTYTGNFKTCVVILIKFFKVCKFLPDSDMPYHFKIRRQI